MGASAYRLDSLVGQAGAAALFYGATVDGYTRAASTDPLVIASVTITTEAKPGAGGAVPGINEFYRVAAVNDATNAVTLNLFQGNTIIGTVRDYVIGFTATSLLLSTTPANTLVSVLTSHISAEPLLGVLAASTVASGTVIAYSSTATFTGALGGRSRSV